MRVDPGVVATCCAAALLVLLVGCGRQELIPFSSPLVVPADTSPLPVPVPSQPEPSPTLLVSSATSPSRTPTVSQIKPSPTPIPITPTSQPGMATVTGTVRRRGTDVGIRGIELYLGEVIETTDPKRPVVGLDKAGAPRAMLDARTGAFVFYNVHPGRYALMVERPLLVPVLVRDPERGGTLFLTIEADQTLELGNLPVDIPE